MVRDFVPPDYPPRAPLVPHGMSVVLNAPAVFRFTASANPERHLHAARLLGADTAGTGPDDAGELLAQAIIRMIAPDGGCPTASAPSATPPPPPLRGPRALPQQRVTRLSPRPVDDGDLKQLFLDSLRLW